MARGLIVVALLLLPALLAARKSSPAPEAPEAPEVPEVPELLPGTGIKPRKPERNPDDSHICHTDKLNRQCPEGAWCVCECVLKLTRRDVLHAHRQHASRVLPAL